VSEERRGALSEALPGYLRNPAPVYPRLARERGYEGTVLLEIDVLVSGRPGTVQVRHSSGYPLLDDAAVQAVRRWTFRPAQRGYTPVSLTVELPIRFRLVDGSASLD
jgi:protein TonB